ncbi:hypothetical protein BCR36DRAFT_583192 [Piromyces finnis]|uniref:Sugar transporter SWEET1 n=1 Tax=Piromyces finnis TaxID=1754191 RepID=A0A1Y1VAF7_9FUNG|nr:hypothetical protein BCR36DRAFT_583192 [Piromyces finnis]|eukprot:ORX51147.1 hypothetical protein BCR36DRAFT_583192 [Piromyces finnis]
MTFFSCSLWEKYGILKGDLGIIFSNFIGIIITTHVIFVYYKNSRDLKPKVEKSFTIIILALISILTYVKLNRGITSYNVLGFICVISSLLMLVSPLKILKEVVKTRENSHLSIQFILISFISSSLWTLYGYFINDKFIIIPNGLGCLLAAIQALIYKIYSKEYNLPHNTIQMTPFHLKN